MEAESPPESQSFFAHKNCFAAAILPSHRILAWEHDEPL